MSDKQNISAKLWEMANVLRGTMDASEYKNYILPFMFYRYLSNNQKEFIQINDIEEFYEVSDESEMQDYVSDLVGTLGYAIRPQYLWEALIDKINTHKIVASDIQDMLEDFSENAKLNTVEESDFSSIFKDVNLGDTRLGSSTNERAKALFDIILLVDEFDFKDDKGKDILGDVYEYLIGQFAANAGKKGGEFYTPHQVSRILARIVTLGVNLEENEQFSVYDPTMGSGSLLLTVQKELPGGDRLGVIKFYGQELNTTTYNLGRMNLMMHGVNFNNMSLRRANTLEMDWPSEKGAGNIELPTIFDAVVANPPYSQKWDGTNDKDPRFRAGLAPKSKADFAFIQHGIYHLSDKGTMSIVLPHGVLFRGASEGKIRKNLIEENRLDAVIGLPANLFYGTSIPTCILVFKGVGARVNRDVLFIDASNDFEKMKNQNVLKDEHVDKIIETYKNRETIEKYSYLATIEEIRENDFNLNIPRYVDTFEEEEVVPLNQLLQEFKQIEDELEVSKNKLSEMLSELTSSDEEISKELQDFVASFGRK